MCQEADHDVLEDLVVAEEDRDRHARDNSINGGTAEDDSLGMERLASRKP